MAIFTPKISGIRNRNFEADMITAEAAECRDYFARAVSAEVGDRSRAQLINAIARATGMTERRVVGIIRAEVKKVWAHELTKVRIWHDSWCDREILRLNSKAELLKAAGAARRARNA